MIKRLLGSNILYDYQSEVAQEIGIDPLSKTPHSIVHLGRNMQSISKLTANEPKTEKKEDL